MDENEMKAFELERELEALKRQRGNSEREVGRNRRREIAVLKRRIEAHRKASNTYRKPFNEKTSQSTKAAWARRKAS